MLIPLAFDCQAMKADRSPGMAYGFMAYWLFQGVVSAASMICVCSYMDRGQDEL